MAVIEQIKEVVLEANGEVVVEPNPVEEGVAALQKVTIRANVPSAMPATLSVTENGTYSPQEGSMYSSVVVDVPADVNNQDKIITENGVYTADEGFSGLGTVTVEVEPTEEEKEEYKEAGKAEQLVADKAALASASPIIKNGTKTILDTEVVVNVPSDPEELQAKYDEGEIAGKAAQALADKDVVESFSPITSNGTKVVRLGDETARLTVNVEGGSSEYFDVIEIPTSVSTGDATRIVLPETVDPATCPLNGKTVRLLQANGELATTKLIIINSCGANVNFENPEGDFSCADFYGDTIVAKGLGTKHTIKGDPREVSIKCTKVQKYEVADTKDSASNIHIEIPDHLKIRTYGNTTCKFTAEGDRTVIIDGVKQGNLTIEANGPYEHYIEMNTFAIGDLKITNADPGASIRIKGSADRFAVSEIVNLICEDALLPLTLSTSSSAAKWVVTNKVSDFDWSRQTFKLTLPSTMTEVGGFTNLAVSLNIKSAKLLDTQSLKNIVNTVGTTTDAILTMAQVHRDQLSDEDIDILADKGWTVQV